MTTWLLLGAVLVTVYAMDIPKDIRIDQTVQCAEQYQVTTEAEFRLIGTGDSPAADCSFTFKAGQSFDGCQPGLCYMFSTYAVVATPLVTLSVEAGSRVMSYSNQTKLPSGPICIESADTMKIVLSQEAGYKYNEKDPAYQFYVSIFHHCSEKGQVKNVKFEDAVDYATGYHKTDEREEKEKNTFISGILLGFGLACIFLIVLFVAYCYTRNSPNRGPNRSVGMPKVGGFKKKMKTGKGGASKDVEMGVVYKQTDPDKRPEAAALLTSKDPEKPPTDKDSDDDDSKPVTKSTKEEKDPEKGGNDMDIETKKDEPADRSDEKHDSGNAGHSDHTTSETTNDD